MRKNLQEPVGFRRVLELKKISKQPIIDIFIKCLPSVMKVFALNVFVSVSFYLLFVWMPTYLNIFINKAAIPKFNFLLVNTLVMVLLILFTPVIGKWSDKKGRKIFAITSVFSVFILAYPLFYLIVNGGFWGYVAAQIIFVCCICLIDGVLFVVMAELFNTEVRFSGITTGYNLSTSFVGGSAPLICTFLIQKTSCTMMPAIYIMIACCIAMPVVLLNN